MKNKGLQKKEKWNAKGGMKGYFTVEASLIMPMVLAVQVFLIYAMLRQYDRCLLEQDMSIAAVYAGAAGGVEDAGKALERKNDQRQRQRYLIYEEEEVFLNAKGRNVEAHSKGRVRLPDMSWQKVLSAEDFLSLEAGSRIQKLEPGSFLRTCRQLIQGRLNK